MAKEWTDEEVQEEIRKAFSIFREDHIVKSIRGLEEKLSGLAGKRSDTSDSDAGEGDPPPVKDKPSEGNKPRKSVWWGELD